MTIISSRYFQPSFPADNGDGKRSPKPPPQLWLAAEPPFKGFQPLPTESYSQTSDNDAIVIDNGSSHIRAGFSSSKGPLISFPPDVARFRDRKFNRNVSYVGYNAYADATTRGQIKKVFEAGTSVVGNWDFMEVALDQIFTALGVDNGAAGGVGRGIIMTEPVAALNYTRKTMNEILFECYSAPSVAYGLDSLFSYRQNGGSNGLIVSSAHSSTHVIPVLNSKPLMSSVSRLNWGGWHCAEYLMKLIRLKYPHFPAQIKDYQIEQMVREHCYISQDFPQEMRTLLDWSGLEDRDHIIQYPYTEHFAIEKSQEELDRVAEKKRQGGIRLQEQAAKMRLEKLVQKEQELEYYKDLQQRLIGQNKKETKRLLDEDEFKDEGQLQKLVVDLEKRIRKARNKDLGPDAQSNDQEEEPQPQSFPLLDIPDADLSEGSLKQKRHQRLMKSGIEARARAKAEKEAEATRVATLAAEDENRRLNQFEDWVADRRQQRQNLLNRIKERDRFSRDASNRKSLASQMRMKTLANLASDTPGRKRRRGGGDKEDDDGFGANDEDWGVYRTVGNEPPGSDDEEEEDLDAEMKKMEAELLEHDPSFDEGMTMGAERDWRKSLMHAFLRGPRPYDAESAGERHQVHLNVERIRVPEVVFQPSIAGVDQAGLVDIASSVLDSTVASRGGEEVREKLLRDVFVTGGNTLFKGFEERLRRELRALLPSECELLLRGAKDPVLDAWRGAAGWAKTKEYREGRVTRAEYEERGSEYLKETSLGNLGVG